jgi:hypothetical protein
MSRNGSGTYSLAAGNPVVTGTTISSTWANNTLIDIATALTNSVAANGETPITGNIQMSTFKFTGLGSGVNAFDSVALDVNKNIAVNNAIAGYTTTATTGGTTTLSIASAQLQDFTGTLKQIVVMPLLSTLTNGHKYVFNNYSTDQVTIYQNAADNAGANIVVLDSGDACIIKRTSSTAWSGTISAQRNGTIGRNKIVNGGFRVNQVAYVSGTSIAVAPGVLATNFAHDMWRNGTNPSNYTFTQSKGNTTVTIGAGSFITAVEDVNVQNTKYVLSWSGGAVARFGVNGAAPSGNFAASPIYITTAVVGTQMNFEFAMAASLGGSTVVNSGSGTLGTVQCEEGVYQTTFENNKYDQVLRECQRYLPTISIGTNATVAGQAISTTQGIFPVSFGVPARIAPTGVLFSAATMVVSNSTGGSISTLSVGFAGATVGNAQLNATVSTGLAAGNATTLYTSSGTVLATFTGVQI